MNAKLITLLCASCAILGGVAGGNIIANQKPAFDYESCKAIIAKGGEAANPGVPENWKAMVTTPGGNWCIRTRG